MTYTQKMYDALRRDTAGKQNRVTDLLDEIDRLNELNRWIFAGDRVPNNPSYPCIEPVWVYYYDGEMGSGAYNKFPNKEECYFSLDGYGGEIRGDIYWMPKPPPPPHPKPIVFQFDSNMTYTDYWDKQVRQEQTDIDALYNEIMDSDYREEGEGKVKITVGTPEEADAEITDLRSKGIEVMEVEMDSTIPPIIDYQDGQFVWEERE